MKSAWMLTAVTGFGLVIAIGGCMQPSWGISPPVGWSRFGPTGPDAADPASAEAAAVPAETRTQPPTTAPAGADPSVAELTQRIEALARRMSAQAGTAPATQPAVVTPATLVPQPVVVAPAPVPAPPTTAPAPAFVQTAPGAPSPAMLPDPSPAPTPLARAATQPVAADPPVANAPMAIAGNDQKAGTTFTEAAASPTPRSVPIIQPSAVKPQPPASPAATVDIVNIRPVIASAAADPDAALAAANQPAETEPAPPGASLESIVTQMEQTLEQRPPHPEDELRLRLLYLAAGMDAKLAEPVKGMDPIQSELLDAIVKAVASSRQAMLEPLNASNSALAATDELRRLLGQQSGVCIPRVALVTKVASYGDYEAISPLRFKAGSEIHAYLYTEVANFRSEPVDGDRLRTLLGERVQVFDAAGQVVWERHENNIEDRVRSPRRDFFIPFPMKLPATLAPGEYVLKVTIEDRVGGTTDQQRLSFTIQ